MTLTVATAVLNVSRSAGFDALERCVSSVARLGPECEHVIFDGGSADGTLARLRALATGFPSVRVFSEPDRGIYDALNKCLAQARGEFFLVLGADDWLLEPANVLRALDEIRTRQLDLLMAQVQLDNGSLLPERPSGIFCCHQGLLARTSSLRRQGGFDISYRIAADYKSVMRAHAEALRIGTCRSAISHFSQNGISSSSRALRVDEFSRAKAEAFGRTDAERERIRAYGAIPFQVCRTLMMAPSPSTRTLGRKFLFQRLIYRKIRTSACSVRYLFGLPVFRHRQKTVK